MIRNLKDYSPTMNVPPELLESHPGLDLEIEVLIRALKREGGIEALRWEVHFALLIIATQLIPAFSKQELTEIVDRAVKSEEEFTTLR